MPLLKEDELDNVVHKYDVNRHSHDNSVCSRLLAPLWGKVATTIIPADISPNALSLGALVCLLQAAYLCHTYYADEPAITTYAAVFLICAFFTLDSLDAIHAVNVGSNTTLTLIFDSFCSSFGTVFLTLIVCWCFGVTDPKTLWYAVQTAQLILLNKHIRGAVKNLVSYWLFNGPGELLSFVIMLLVVRASFGLEFFGTIFFAVVNSVRTVLSTTGVVSALNESAWYQYVDAEVPDVEVIVEDPYGSTLYATRAIYIFVLFFTGIRVLWMTSEFHETKIRLALCLAYRSFPALLMWFLPMRSVLNGQYGVAHLICDGLFISIVTTDVLVCRIAKRQLHPWVVMMGMVSLVSSVTCIFFAFFYGTWFEHGVGCPCLKCVPCVAPPCLFCRGLTFMWMLLLILLLLVVCRVQIVSRIVQLLE